MNDPTTQDQLLDGRVTVLQPAGGYRVAIDPIFLAAAVPAQKGDRVLDLGGGAGAASLCLAARLPGVKVVGFDIQENLIRLAQQSAEVSDLEGQVSFVPGDILEPPENIEPDRFDHVMANPPYVPKNSGHPPPDPVKAAANVEGKARLGDWVQSALQMVSDGGSVTFVHRYDRRDEVVRALSAGVGNIRTFPLWPKKMGDGAKRVLVQGVKGIAGEAETLPGLVLHREDGSYSEEAEDVLRSAQGLILGEIYR